MRYKVSGRDSIELHKLANQFQDKSRKSSV